MDEHSLHQITAGRKLERGRWRAAALLILGDVLSFVIAFALGKAAHWLIIGQRYLTILPNWNSAGEVSRFAIFFAMCVLALIIFSVNGHYTRGKPFWDELKGILVTLLILTLADASLVFLGQLWEVSRFWYLAAWSVSIVTLPLLRFTLKRRLHRRGLWNRPVVVFGSGQNAMDTAETIAGEPFLGKEVVLFVDEPGDAEEGTVTLSTGKQVPVMLMPAQELEVVLQEMGQPEIVIALSSGQAIEPLSRRLSTIERDVYVVPPLRGVPLFGLQLQHFFNRDLLMLRARNNLARLFPRILKRFFDLVVGVALLLLLWPLLLFITWRIRADDGKPALFIQPRVGRRGRVFRCYKFRSMTPDAEAVLERWKAEEPERYAQYVQGNFKLRDDPRVTRTGRWLRRWSLDELPQLFNVLRGDMSLVGPRPLLEREIDDYGEDFAYYRLTRPGITGIWQVSGRSAATFADRRDNDRWYVKNWSMWYDIMILARTVRVVLVRQGAW